MGTSVPKILRSVIDDSAECRPAQSTWVALLAAASASTQGELASGRLKMHTSKRLDEAVAVWSSVEALAEATRVTIRCGRVARDGSPAAKSKGAGPKECGSPVGPSSPLSPMGRWTANHSFMLSAKLALMSKARARPE